MAKRQPPYRVIQWGTGAVGKYCIQRTIESPHLRQVGARVFSDAKNGKDVGEIAHLAPTGVKAAMDKQARPESYRAAAGVAPNGRASYQPLGPDRGLWHAGGRSPVSVH